MPLKFFVNDLKLGTFSLNENKNVFFFFAFSVRWWIAFIEGNALTLTLVNFHWNCFHFLVDFFSFLLISCRFQTIHISTILKTFLQCFNNRVPRFHYFYFSPATHTQFFSYFWSVTAEAEAKFILLFLYLFISHYLICLFFSLLILRLVPLFGSSVCVPV